MVVPPRFARHTCSRNIFGKQKNLRIFVVLYDGKACRALAEGILFDELVPTLSNYKFMAKRLISVSVDVDIVTVIILYPMDLE